MLVWWSSGSFSMGGSYTIVNLSLGRFARTARLGIGALIDKGLRVGIGGMEKSLDTRRYLVRITRL